MSLLPRRRLPILMYHRFGSQADGDPELWIRAETFRHQLAWLRDHGYRCLTLSEAYAELTASSPARKAVLLTIDDGFSQDLRLARDLLLDNGFRAAVFVAAGLLGQAVELRHPSSARELTSSGTLVGRAGLEDWLAAGLDVGSHALTHIDLTTASTTELRAEVQDSKAHLEQILARPVDDFCYPFAHHDERARAEVAAAGYRAAYAGEPPVDDLYAVARMMVYPRDDLARFRRKVSGYYFWISALHQKLRRFVRN